MNASDHLRDLEHEIARLKSRPSIKAAHATLDKMMAVLRELVKANGEKST